MRIPLSFPRAGISLFPLFVGLAIFTGLALYQWPLPGLHYDEAQEVIPAVQLVLGLPTLPLRGGAIHLLGRDFPLMIQNYIGAVSTYLALPFFKILGVSVFSLRLMSITLGVLTLVLAYRVAGVLFDRRVADLTVLLLALNPSFIFWSRQGTFVTAVLSLLSTGSLLALLLWYKTRNSRYLYLGSFLLGLGVWSKLSFLWFWGGLLVAGIIALLYRLRIKQETVHIEPKQWLVAVSFLLLGASPLLLYNLQTQGTVEEILRYLNTSYYGVSNLAFFPNLGARLGNLDSLLDGGHFWYLGTTSQNLLYPLIFWLLALTTLLFVLRRPVGWRGVIFIAILLATMVPLSTLTVSDFKPTHYILLLPLPQIFVAAGLSTWSQGNKTLRALALLLALALMGWDLKSDLQYHQALTRTGGYPDHSAAIYDLANYLAEQGQRPVVAMDWGFRNPIYFLTKGRINPDEIFGYGSFAEPDPGFAERLGWYLDQAETIYIFHAPPWTIFQREETFQALVQQAEKRIEIAKHFYDRSGVEVFIAAKVVDNP